MNSGNPCSVCGSTDLNLVDGFYYCVECGTQDATARETIVEHQILAERTYAQTFKKKIRQVKDDKIEMTREWYKWHSFNFVLSSLADELIKLGAKPSFKMKLLWVWTRYIKKYQNKEELGLSNEINETSNTNDRDKEDKIEEPITIRKYFHMKDCVFRRINGITPLLIFTLIYVALNLDKSDVQLYHLMTFFKEKRFNVYDVFKFIPEEINFRNIRDWQHYIHCNTVRVVFSTYRVRCLGLSLCKDLDLGYPVIPDIRKLIENYTIELCLPEDFKNLVYSLIYQYPCEFLNVNQKVKMNKVPDYEGITMAYVLVALKMCFGLDDEYELRISNVVEKINEQENHLKCYKSGLMETDRLFSFREWLTYLQFRKKILLQNCLHTETEHFNDIDNFMYIEYVEKDASGSKMSLEDEITLNILNKMPLDELDVIPKSLFEASLTPMTSYSKIIGEYHKEDDVRFLLCEDFSKYSLKYVCGDLNLIDKGTNILIGVQKSNKPQTRGDIKIKFTEKPSYTTVFIKNCENTNWMKTKPPSMAHITVLHKDGKDIDSDLGYDSHSENTSDKDINITTSNSTLNIKNKNDDDVQLETVREEDENVNIYDDDFVEIYYKEEVEAARNEDLEEFPDESQLAKNNNNNNDSLLFSDEEEYDFNDTIAFNPNTFNRERVIKELILTACKKHKIPIPQEYRSDKIPKRKLIYDEAGVSNEPKPKKNRTCRPGEAKQEVQNLLETYYNCVQDDVFNNITKQVQEAIRNANATKDEVHESIGNQRADDVFNDTGQQLNDTDIHENENGVNESEINNEQVNTEADQTGLEVIDNIESTLFDEDSDCDANIDEITPKNDPKFDEKNFDVKQLYIKVQEETKVDKKYNFHDTIASLPEIKEMLKKEMNKSADSNEINNIFDPEDDLPLTMVKEDMLFQQEFGEKLKENREKLINNENIPNYYYWLRHYKGLAKIIEAQAIFDNEAKKNLPHNFRFILNECASIVNRSSFQIYKCMQYLEIMIRSQV